MENTNNIEKKEYDLSFMINKTTDLAKKYFKEMLILSLILTFATTIINMFITFMNTTYFSKILEELKFENGYAPVLDYIRINIEMIITYIFALLIALLILHIINLTITATFIYYLENAFKNKKITLKESFLMATDKIWVLIVTEAILAIFLLGLTFLLIIPALIFFVFWIFYLYSSIIRDKNYIEALKYSKHLIENNWFRSLGYGIIFSLLIGLINFVFGLALTPIYLASAFIENIYLTHIINIPSYLISYLTGFIVAIGLLVYFKMLEKEKGIANKLE